MIHVLDLIPTGNSLTPPLGSENNAAHLEPVTGKGFFRVGLPLAPEILGSLLDIYLLNGIVRKRNGCWQSTVLAIAGLPLTIENEGSLPCKGNLSILAMLEGSLREDPFSVCKAGVTAGTELDAGVPRSHVNSAGSASDSLSIERRIDIIGEVFVPVRVLRLLLLPGLAASFLVFFIVFGRLLLSTASRPAWTSTNSSSRRANVDGFDLSILVLSHSKFDLPVFALG